MLKKVLVLSLLAACVCGCRQNRQVAAVPGDAPPPAEPGSVSYPVAGNPKIVISRGADADIHTAGFSSYNSTPGVRRLAKETGIEAGFVELVDENAYRVYLAGGSLPDIIMASKDFYPGGGPKMHEDGLARDLTGYLQAYAPDYWAYINSDPQLYKAIQEPDGRHYALAGYFRKPGSVYSSWQGLAARKEFLDALGMEPPATADELYAFLRRCRDELGCEVPWMSANYRFADIFAGGSLPSAFGFPRAGAYHIDGKVRFGAYEPEYKELLAFMHRLFSERLLDNNFAVTEEPAAHSSMLNGRSALIYTAASRIQNMTAAAPDASRFTLVGLRALSTARGARPMYNYAEDAVTFTYWCFIPEKTRDVENALKLLNYLFTPQGSMLANFGEEGLTYDTVGGEPVFTEFTTNNPGGQPLDGILRTYGLLNFPIVQDDRMSSQRFALPQQVQAMEAWADSDGAMYRIVNPTILPRFASEYAGLLTDISTFIEESRAQFISGAKPLDEFGQYTAALKRMGMDRLIEILQASYDGYNR